VCRPASFIITKSSVFFSTLGDSHEAIIRENTTHPDGARGPTIVRVEIVPPANRYDLPLDQWLYAVDQDILPDWYDAEDAERRARVALSDWAAHHIIRSGRIDGISDGMTRILLGDAQSHGQTGGECDCYDSSQSRGQTGGLCICYDSSQSRGQTGGLCICYDSSQSRGQTGGECICYGSSQSHGQTGGECRCRGASQSHGQTGGECYVCGFLTEESK
jgi:hypothetical protein